ncbi:permease [Acidihalobacter yilgarnensis]|uniref:Permease n=2 Tax=Acidihalobacter yilgarnensis TaxID=2819280 RepID=A0A1D8IM03_9GAMM|nr:DMT family transporter [Acidihalobacter yilgarnensis]AOU97482.1 permease [Acidihalobacter yilgarnensis]
MTTIPAWIPITLAAAVFQVWRTALQVKLRGALSASGAGFVRYLYALPLDALMLGLALWWLQAALPEMSWRFLLLCLVGGVAQIFGTILLITAFGLRNFVVGTAYAKTEAAQLVILSIVVLGVQLPTIAVAGIFLAVAGVLLLSFAGQKMGLRELLRASAQPAALCGLGAGFAFAMTALALRAASLDLGVDTAVAVKATLILLVTNLCQTLVQGGYMALRTPTELRACLGLWRRAAPVGILSALGSGCWFAGFALTHVALVRGLGQVEILFTLLIGHFYLKERVRTGEIAGLVLVTLGVLGIAFADMH